MASNETQCTYKVVLIGDSGVGKTCLTRRCDGKTFDTVSKPTIGVNHATVVVHGDPGRTIRAKLWDVAGQERFRAPVNYYDNASGVMLVYDVTKCQTFENVRAWLREVQDHGSVGLGLILVGNKSDLGPNRAVSYDEGESFAGANGMAFVETSALTGDNVDTVLITLLNRCSTAD